MRGITDSLRGLNNPGKAELRITGQVTPLARQQLQSLGWTVIDNVRDLNPGICAKYWRVAGRHGRSRPKIR